MPGVCIFSRQLGINNKFKMAAGAVSVSQGSAATRVFKDFLLDLMEGIQVTRSHPPGGLGRLVSRARQRNYVVGLARLGLGEVGEMRVFRNRGVIPNTY